jgi:hypothetical protein
MKTGMTFFGATVILLFLILLGGCGPGKYVPKANEEINGTWTNEKIFPQKVVNTADGWKQYNYMSDPTPLYEGTGGIASKWRDSEGNIWYKIFSTVTSTAYKGTKSQELDKLSKSGTVWESVSTMVREFNSDSYPTKIDPNDSSYRIYYRSEK